MRNRRFLIPSLIAAGFAHHDAALAFDLKFISKDKARPEPATLFDVFRQDHLVLLAQHRSHSSHSSHSSHRSGSGGHYSHASHTSHRSSTGGYGPDYAPLYSPAPAPPPPPPPSSPPPPLGDGIMPLRTGQPGEASAPKPVTLSGRTERFKAIVRRVQIALLAQGYYHDAIDGVVGPKLRKAIRQFQTDRSLAVTGTITAEILDALRVSTQ